MKTKKIHFSSRVLIVSVSVLRFQYTKQIVYVIPNLSRSCGVMCHAQVENHFGVKMFYT